MPGYCLEYASTSRAKCKGRKPCGGTVIHQGSLRLGCTVEFNGKECFAWRHWGCTTTKVIANMKAQFPDASDVDGFEELRAGDQAKIIQAWKDGRVADEDSVSKSFFKPPSFSNPSLDCQSFEC
ncbi:zf-PARP-domain-containing protein [Gymnopus androsaceus JB14]|uniref:Zf-PARP-domain-containing protein n=1 Tax=Gymnopus androsaceus JB14 TaxID=1447944 RepID=A0A6A4GHW2_9AGAR|nr:zf-PARP-domain-containing protein [Gymnopus androsaceus JB14]KAE9391494.1 zf-PARP-domain-containing protein [Gymnopus androsaceus JB14]